ncbi:MULTISPECIES: AraC family transcriptional regulator [unclassified Allomuricauda]|uniref:helix-turn-helix domain-containing protein n=1 Tax=unclassified Allomuricauda TaxID=2615049 RepID=UPI00273FD41A|nr:MULTISPECIES: helix-turn-helix transcriptional regulator [unclassified Allomuricauda]
MVISNFHPQPPLDALFRECYYIHMAERSGLIPIIDDCCYDFVFFKEADGYFYYGPDQQAQPIGSNIFTINQLHPPYRIEAANSLTFFTIKVQPWANAYFFSNVEQVGIVDVSQLHSGLIPFHYDIFSAKQEERFVMAEAFMRNTLEQLTPSMALVRAICETIYEKRGMVTVNELSDQFQRSRQYLGKIFKKEVMYSLKKFIITVRILDLVKYRAKHAEVSLTELSYDYGYFDQPHFINDFKKVCGVPPLEFFNNLPEFLLRHQ